MPKTKAKSPYSVPNLDRTLDILELLANHPGGLNRAELSQSLGLSTNMTFRIAATLVSRGYLRRDDASKCYQLTSKFLQLGQDSIDDYSLAERAWKDMTALRDETGETIQLNALVGHECVILERAIGTHPLCVYFSRGLRGSPHAVAHGKVFMAGMEPEARKIFIRKLNLQKFTTETIITEKGLLAEIEKTAKNGYATDWEECSRGICCIAAPIRNAAGKTVAAICLTGPAERVTPKALKDYAAKVVGCANQISFRLGWRETKSN